MAPMSYKQAATAPKGPPITPTTGTGSKTKPVDVLSPASQPSLAKDASEAAAKADEKAKSGELMLSARVSEVNGLASLAAMGAVLSKLARMRYLRDRRDAAQGLFAAAVQRAHDANERAATLIRAPV